MAKFHHSFSCLTLTRGISDNQTSSSSHCYRCPELLAVSSWAYSSEKDNHDIKTARYNPSKVEILPAGHLAQCPHCPLWPAARWGRECRAGLAKARCGWRSAPDLQSLASLPPLLAEPPGVGWSQHQYRQGHSPHYQRSNSGIVTWYSISSFYPTNRAVEPVWGDWQGLSSTSRWTRLAGLLYSPPVQRGAGHNVKETGNK